MPLCFILSPFFLIKYNTEIITKLIKTAIETITMMPPLNTIDMKQILL